MKPVDIDFLAPEDRPSVRIVAIRSLLLLGGVTAALAAGWRWNDASQRQREWIERSRIEQASALRTPPRATSGDGGAEYRRALSAWRSLTGPAETLLAESEQSIAEVRGGVPDLRVRLLRLDGNPPLLTIQAETAVTDGPAKLHRALAARLGRSAVGLPDLQTVAAAEGETAIRFEIRIDGNALPAAPSPATAH